MILAAATPNSPHVIGQTVTHYRISAKLGQGGMGEVYRATDTKLGRDVAIKVLPASISQHPESLIRFEREAKALAALNHPNNAVLTTDDEGMRRTRSRRDLASIRADPVIRDACI